MINKYEVIVKHDNGKIKITTAATSEEAAKAIVMTAENCPSGAIIKIKRL